MQDGSFSSRLTADTGSQSRRDCARFSGKGRGLKRGYRKARLRPSRPLPSTARPPLRDQPFDDPAYRFEPKYNGFRGLLYLSGRECHFRSKRGNVLRQFRELCDWVRHELRVKEVILDGEVVALDPEGRQDFCDLLARRGNFHYAAFDVLWLNGKDLREP
jgi:bifunctional non-homologous end joining protein LigD